MGGKKHVLICMASRILGGPGKGLVQFLRCGGMEKCHPVMVAFDSYERGDSEFITTMQRTGVDMALIRQKSPFDLSMITQLRRIAENRDCDLIQSHGYKSHVLCLILKILTGKPWVAFVHGWTTENLKMRLYKWLDFILVRFADRIISVSENTATRLGPMIDHRVEIIPNAVDEAEYDLNHDPGEVRGRFDVTGDDILLCTVGRLSPEKGHEFLVEAIGAKKKELAGVKFILVGDGPCRKDLERRVRQHGLEETVFFAGYSNDMSAYYAACDGLVLPSLSEGMPNVALEAMLFGKPVLATRVGGVPEVVEEACSGYLVPHGDSEALGFGLTRFVSDRERMRDMGKRGKDIVKERFEPYSRVDSIVEVYDKVGG